MKPIDVPSNGLLDYNNEDGGDSFHYKLANVEQIIWFTLSVYNQDDELIPNFSDYRRREADEAMATRERPLKKRSRPSRSEAGKTSRRRRRVRGRKRSWGVAKTCPSSKRCPSGKLEKISRASRHGQPERMAWRKTQKIAK